MKMIYFLILEYTNHLTMHKKQTHSKRFKVRIKFPPKRIQKNYKN